MTTEDALAEIRATAQKGELLFTRHAAQEALAELISVDEVREALLNGTILEDYPDHQRGPCCLIQGKTEKGRDLHLVVTKGKTPIRIITAYQPRLPYWKTPTERAR